MILIFFGPPGAGKGTQAKFVSDELNLIHLSTGEMLRNQLKKQNDLSEELKKNMDSGQLVSDAILNQIVLERISEKDCENGYIFDGYPRTLTQAHFIDKYFLENNTAIDFFLEFKLNTDDIIKRITNRAKVEKRKDDNVNINKTRLDKYYLQTKPVIEHYKKLYDSAYHIVEGNQEIQQINKLLLNYLKK